MQNNKITTLFLDIGGVLLTNGWGRTSRNNTLAHFMLDSEEVNERHHLTFDAYEEGKLTLHEYLKRVVFYEQRAFSEKDFIAFMFSQSLAYPDTLHFFKEIKKQYGLKVFAVSNEGRELNNYRIKQFRLTELFDAFISSCFVHFRKPDEDIFRMAIDTSQTLPEHAIYIDDRLLFVEIARGLGMHGIHHRELEDTKQQLKALGFALTLNKQVI